MKSITLTTRKKLNRKRKSKKWSEKNSCVGVGELRVDCMVNDPCQTTTDLLSRAEAAEAKAEKMEIELNAAVNDINAILSLTELCPILCEWCKWDKDCDSSKMPEWRGEKEG